MTREPLCFIHFTLAP